MGLFATSSCLYCLQRETMTPFTSPTTVADLEHIFGVKGRGKPKIISGDRTLSHLLFLLLLFPLTVYGDMGGGRGDTSLMPLWNHHCITLIWEGASFLKIFRKMMGLLELLLIYFKYNHGVRYTFTKCKTDFEDFFWFVKFPYTAVLGKETKLKIFELFRTAYFLISSLPTYLDTIFFPSLQWFWVYTMRRTYSWIFYLLPPLICM